MGAGAVGGYFGARLAAGGEDVTLVARGAHLAALRERGLVIRHPDGEDTIRVRATDEPADAGVADIVLVLVKLYDTREAIERVRPAVGPDTAVVSFQNGVVAVEALSAAFGRERVAGGVALISAVVAEPGVIAHRSRFAKLVFGPLDGPVPPMLHRFAKAMQAAGLEHELAGDISRRIWEKFVFLSAVSAITALTRLPIGPILADPRSRALLRDALAESHAVARSREPALAESLVDESMARIAGFAPNMQASMADDLHAGKRLELEELSGRVVALGEAAGIATPVHRTVLAALSPWRNGPPAA